MEVGGIVEVKNFEVNGGVHGIKVSAMWLLFFGRFINCIYFWWFWYLERSFFSFLHINLFFYLKSTLCNIWNGYVFWNESLKIRNDQLSSIFNLLISPTPHVLLWAWILESDQKREIWFNVEKMFEFAFYSIELILLPYHKQSDLKNMHEIGCMAKTNEMLF